MTLIAQNVSRFIFALIGVIPFAVASFSVHTDFIAKVTAISDGDTLTVLDSQHQKIKIRLTEIDAPEKAQPFSNRSKQSLSEMCFSKSATLADKGKDRYGRTLARL